MRTLLLLIIVGTLFSCAQIQQLADKYQKEVQKQKMEREKKEREQQQSQQTVIITEGSSSSSCTQSTSSTQNSSTQNTPVRKAASFVTTLSQQEIQEYLDFHNKARKEVGVPPVQWSDEIAAYSQEWADYLAQNNRFEHRSDHRYGENIAMHYDNALVNGAKLWYQEKKHYKGAVLNSSNWSKAGHYTQMVWRATRYIGAGKATNVKGQIIIVGNYDPAGNMMGQKAY
jgi:uncharacterized protein YkwD